LGREKLAGPLFFAGSMRLDGVRTAGQNAQPEFARRLKFGETGLNRGSKLFNHARARAMVEVKAKRTDRIATVLLVVSAAMLVLGFDVAICPLAGIAAVPCPSCGLTRATLALLGGDLRRAQALHPAVVPVLLYVTVVVVGAPKWQRHSAFVAFMRVGGAALLVGLVLLWIARFLGYFGGPVPVVPWRV
jgi:hypothetical protein